MRLSRVQAAGLSQGLSPGKVIGCACCRLDRNLTKGAFLGPTAIVEPQAKCGNFRTRSVKAQTTQRSVEPRSGKYRSQAIRLHHKPLIH